MDALERSRLLTAKEVATRLGVTHWTVYKWLRQKENPLPSYSLNGILRVDRTEMEAWVASQRTRRP